MQCQVSIKYWRQYANSYISYTMARVSLLTWTQALSNARQHTLAVVLLHQLSLTLRKEFSGYKFCDDIVSRLICISLRVLRMEAPLRYLYHSRIRALHLVLSHRLLRRES